MFSDFGDSYRIYRACDLVFLILPSSSGCLIEPNVVYGGDDILNGVADTVQGCAALALQTEGAKFWTYLVESKQCLVKASNAERRASQDHMSGSANCAAAVDFSFDAGEYLVSA